MRGEEGFGGTKKSLSGFRVGELLHSRVLDVDDELARGILEEVMFELKTKGGEMGRSVGETSPERGSE